MSNIDDLSVSIPSEDWVKLFPKINEKKLKDDEFELGLVLGGTVSAGAYPSEHFLVGRSAYPCPPTLQGIDLLLR